MGSRAQCVVMGTRELVAGEPPRVIRLNIAQEPTHMLDGPYPVRFGESSARVERRGGLWLFPGFTGSRRNDRFPRLVLWVERKLGPQIR